MTNIGQLTVHAKYNEEFFSPICQATCPSSWDAELEPTEKLLDFYNANNHFSHFSLRGVGNTKKEAIQDIVDELKKDGLTGTLKIKTYNF